MLTVYQKQFLHSAVAVQALKFGDFTLKSGRKSPYFFNAATFADGSSLEIMAKAYAQEILRLRAEGVEIELLFGPAYKGIPLVAAIAVVLRLEHGINLPWAFNRKEVKDHGEGGILVGAAVAGKKTLIVDDVLTAGSAVRQSLALLTQEGAYPTALLVALDRQEKTDTRNVSALMAIEQEHKIAVRAVVNLAQLMDFVKEHAEFRSYFPQMQKYREQYGLAEENA